METYENKAKNIRIVANEIQIGKQVHLGGNISISTKGIFRLGDYSYLGKDITMQGNNIEIGKYFYNSGNLRVGGGGRQHPDANLKVGDRCTFCNNLLNVCEPITIGDDVGLSEEVSLITHGFWLNVLDGYPAAFAGITIENGVIVGYRTVILMGVRIAERIVIGANSAVTKSLTKHGIYVGSPAKFIKEIVPPSLEEKIIKTQHIIDEYFKVAKYHKLNPKITIDYPVVTIDNKFNVNFETLEFWGEEDYVTDDFRDYIRKWGIRIFTERSLASNFKFD
jgi:acetyltransferase-like isoleucine patch superfamily enzyme